MRDIKYTNKNKTYYDIVKDILEHDEFLKLKDIKHHGLDRYEHNKRVSYYSYLTAKALRLDYESVARAGALHDFFHDVNYDATITKRLDTLERHPRYSFETASKHFDLNDKEKNIIDEDTILDMAKVYVSNHQDYFGEIIKEKDFEYRLNTDLLVKSKLIKDEFFDEEFDNVIDVILL